MGSDTPVDAPRWVRGTLRRRYKRFLADAALECGDEVTAHVANPGAMTGLAEPGLAIWMAHRPDPRRKLAYSWVVVETVTGALAGVDTGAPNRLVGEALARRSLPEFAAYSLVLREQKYGEGSRVDFLLKDPELPDLYLEVKSVTLSRIPGLAEFPDARTARGARHLGELARVAASGARAAVLYVVQREDCNRFSVARDIDPTYAAAADAAVAAGVEMHCRFCRVRPDSVSLGETLRFVEVAEKVQC